MVKYREILRLNALGVSVRNTAYSAGCSTATVQAVLRRAKGAGLVWPLPEELTDAQIKRVLYPTRKHTDASKAEINHEYIAEQLKRRGTTLMLIWSEYCEQALSRGEEPYLYSAFCSKHRQWRKEQGLTMHIEHVCAQQIQVDWVGDIARVCNPDTGEALKAYIFVATLPFSGYTFAEAFFSMNLESWIEAHTHAFEFFGGTTPVLVPDNCKTAITKHTRDELVLNEEYRRMAEYYRMAIVPARARRPKDKAHVEMTVGVVERQVLAPMRDLTFFSLSDLNLSIKEGIDKLNARPFQKKEGSRKSVYLDQEKKELCPLPKTPYEFTLRKRARVNFNYHVAFEGNWYSVPFSYIKREVDIAAKRNSLSISCDGTRIAIHPRLRGTNCYSTNPEHMPDAHKDFVEWNGKRFCKWAKNIGPATEQVIEGLLASRVIEQQAYRSCRALLGLEKTYSKELLEQACSKALQIAARPSYKTCKNFIVALSQDETPQIDSHAYLRGADYYKNFE